MRYGMLNSSTINRLRRIPPLPIYSILRSGFLEISYVLRGSFLTHSGIIELRGLKLFVGDQLISKNLYRHFLLGSYEAPEYCMVQDYVAPSDVVLELGAGVGFIGLACARIVGGENVHSFEANPQLEALIRRNYSLSGMHPSLNIVLLSRGIGKESFFIKKDFWSSSTTVRGDVVEVIVDRRDLNEAVGAIRPTFLIMDIEGGEIDVADYLEPGTIRKLAMELHPDVVSAERIAGMFDTLARKGFTVEYMSADRRHAYLTRTADA